MIGNVPVVNSRRKNLIRHKNSYKDTSKEVLKNFQKSFDDNNIQNVYLLYISSKEYNKRKEQRIEENLKEIRERTNHPTICNDSFNRYKNLKRCQSVKLKTSNKIKFDF